MWGGTVSGSSADNYDGAHWFLDTFRGLAFEDGVLSNGSETLNNSFATNYDQYARHIAIVIAHYSGAAEYRL